MSQPPPKQPKSSKQPQLPKRPKSPRQPTPPISKTPSTTPTVRKKRRRRPSPKLIEPWQFLLISSSMAIAVVGGGVWLLIGVLNPPPSVVRDPNSTPISASEATNSEPQPILKPHERLLSESETIALTTKLAPQIAHQAEVTAQSEDLPQSEVAATIPERSPTPPPQQLVVQHIWKNAYGTPAQPLLFQTPPSQENKRLGEIITGIKQLARNAKLEPEQMSIVLVDLSLPQGAIATTSNANQPQYPASVAKLFWMVALYGQFQQGFLLPSESLEEKLRLMMHESDNNAASEIIDVITRTTSRNPVEIPNDYHVWSYQREQLNVFFNSIPTYRGLNITQKTYPIPDINIDSPIGFDKIMRYDHTNRDSPIRNKLTAKQAAQLMYDIVKNQAISLEASLDMKRFLKRSLKQEDWDKPLPHFNPVQDFFGERLPAGAEIYSKAGWTTQGRHEVAYIRPADRSHRGYILCIFAEQKDYAQNEDFFPEVAAYTYTEIIETSQNPNL